VKLKPPGDDLSFSTNHITSLLICAQNVIVMTAETAAEQWLLSHCLHAIVLILLMTYADKEGEEAVLKAESK